MSLSKTSSTHYSVVVEHDASIEVQIPEAGAEIAGLRIVDLGRDPPKTDNGRVTRRRSTASTVGRPLDGRGALVHGARFDLCFFR